MPRDAKARSLSEPLTISLTADLMRKARILAVARDITISKLIAGLLTEAVHRDLPSVLANLQEAQKGEDQ